MIDLNEYAGTIAAVFRELSVLYGPPKSDHGAGHEWNCAGQKILMTLDAETCADIIGFAESIDRRS